MAQGFPAVVVKALGEKQGQYRLLKEQALDGQRWLSVYAFGSDNLPFGIGVVSCDEDFQVMVVYGRYRDTDRQAAELGKVLRSVRCVARAVSATRLSAAVRLPEKFGRTSDRDFEGYRSVDSEVLMVNFTNGD